MRLKFIACKYTVFIPFRIFTRNIFSFLFAARGLICHFGDELNTYQTYFFFCKIISQLIQSIIDIIRSRFFEIVVYIQQMVFIHNIFQEVVDIQFRTGVDNSFYLIQQLLKLNTFDMAISSKATLRSIA